MQSLGAIGKPRHAWRQSIGPYGVVAVLFGTAVFADVRGAAGDATDRWLYDTRLLMQEAAALIPEVRGAPAGVTTLARGAEIVPGDSGPSAAWRSDAGGVPRAVVAGGVPPGRWVGLRARPEEVGTAVWLPILLGLAALGPLGTLLAAWSTATAPRPRREMVAAWGFLAPSALHLAAFCFVPLLLALYVSVHRWSPIEPTKAFVALGNYGHLIRDPLVWSALGRTLLYALYVAASMAPGCRRGVGIGRGGPGAAARRVGLLGP